MPLARHFFANAAGRAWLDEEGIEGLRGVFFSAVAGLGTLGLFLPRRFHKLYLDLSALPDPEPYRQTLAADSLFMISLPAVVTAMIAALLAPVMFPDETDHITLSPLPLTRRQLFGAKLLALGAIVGALVLGMTALFSIAFPTFTHGRWAESEQLARVVAHAAASNAASLFAFFAVVSLQGLVLLLTPSRFLRTASSVLQCGLIAALVLAVPFLLRLPKLGAWITSEPAGLLLVPTAWFFGLEQFLLGRDSPHVEQLAVRAGVALLIALTIAAGCYAILYRHFESLVFRSDRSRADARQTVNGRKPAATPGIGRRGVWRGVWDFTRKTLVRNRLSQMVFLIAWSIGGAMFVNTLLGILLSPRFAWGSPLPRQSTAVLITLPLSLMVMGVIGVRAAFLLPVNSRANWIFRLMDFPAHRRQHLAAVDRAFVLFGVVPALAIAAPVQIYGIGLRTTAAAATLCLLVGLLLIEIVLAHWRRIPFTCTWLPNKRPLPLLMVFALFALMVLSVAGAIIQAAVYSPGGFLVIGGLLLTTAGAFRWRRRRSWAQHPLQFEDEPFDTLQTLGLHRS